LAELDTLLAAARRDPRRYDCAAVNGSLGIACPKLAGERARAARRQALETQIASLAGEIASAEKRLQESRQAATEALQRASAELARSAPAKVANADAVALATYLGALGISVDVERVNRLLVALAVLVIEMGGGLALAVGMALSEAGRSGDRQGATVQGERSLTERAREGPNASPEHPAEVSQINAVTRSLAPTGRPERIAHDRVLAALHVQGGVLFGSQVALGAAFGWSKTRLHEVLHQLEAQGRVRLSVSSRGTAVRLVGGAA
jgi:hypothetical protein